MSKKILVTILIILLSGLTLLGGVYAGNLFKELGKEFPPFYSKRLNLTDEQKEKIKNILNELKEKSEAILDKIKKNSEKEREILSKEILNEEELNLIVSDQIKNLIDLSYLKKDAYLKIVSILNSDQRKIFPTFIEFFRRKNKFFGNEFIKEKFEEIDSRIKDYLKIGKRLNLTDEQKEILKKIVNEENYKKLRLTHFFELMFLKKRLNLDDEQIEKVKELLKDEKDKEKDLFNKILENNKNQREILKSENFDKEKLSNLIDEYIVLEEEVFSLRKNFYFDFLKILKPDQRKNSPTSIFFFNLI